MTEGVLYRGPGKEVTTEGVAASLLAAIAALERATGKPAGKVTIVAGVSQVARLRVAVDVAGLRDTCTVVVAEELPPGEVRLWLDDLKPKPDPAPARAPPAAPEPYWRHFERKPKRFRG